MKCLKEELNLLGGIEVGVEEDVNRLTLVSSKQKVEKIGSMYWGGVEKELDVLRCIKHEFSCNCNMKHMQK